MMNVTFDTNCIIALEENESTADDLRRIVRSAVEQKLRLRVVAISASERSRRDATSSGEFSGDFQLKIANAGLEGVVEILIAPAIWDMSYWNESMCITEADDANAKQIQRILHPNEPLYPNEPFEPSSEHGRRVNRAIDTWALWTHLHNGGGAFVTSDGNFHKQDKKPRLEQLGTSILRPHEAAARFCR